jgi:hypothetical protein
MDAKALQDEGKLRLRPDWVGEDMVGKLINDEKETNEAAHTKSRKRRNKVSMHPLERATDRARGRGTGENLFGFGFAACIARSGGMAGAQGGIAKGGTEAGGEMLVAPGRVAEAAVHEVT